MQLKFEVKDHGKSLQKIATSGDLPYAKVRKNQSNTLSEKAGKV